MGRESFTFQYIPEKAKSDLLEDLIKQQSDVEEVIRTNSSFNSYVIKSDSYYIEILYGLFSSMTYPSVSIRLALCNPDNAYIRLKIFIDYLIDNCGGMIQCNKNNFESENYKLPQETWNQIMDCLLQSRQVFQQIVGSWRAAIGAEDVFDYFRNNIK